MKENTIYKVQIRLEGTIDSSPEEDEEDGPIWRDFYLDMSKIYGWYLPDLHKVLGKAIIVFTPGDSFYIKQESHVLKYLMENVFSI